MVNRRRIVMVGASSGDARSRATRSELRRAFGAVLKQRRLARELSQEEFAWQAGMDRSYVSQIESGKRSPTIEMLFRLAAGLRMDPAQFVRDIQAQIAPSDEERPEAADKTAHWPDRST